MPPLGPITRRDFIHYLKRLGFDGPYSGGNPQYMVKGQLRLTLPNPHQHDISKEFLCRILRQAGIEVHEWETL